MNTNTVFRFEIFDQDEATKDEFDKRILNSKLNPRIVDEFDHIANGNFVKLSKVRLNYQLERQRTCSSGSQYTEQFNRQLNYRLNQHLNEVNQSVGEKCVRKIRSSLNRSLSQPNRVTNLFFYLYNYYKEIFIEINFNLIYLANLIIYWIKFLVTDLSHYFIFKYLFTCNYKRKVLIKWLQKVTNNGLFLNDSLIRSNNVLRRSENDNYFQNYKQNSSKVNFSKSSINGQLATGENVRFQELFKNGKLLCGLVNHLNANACSRYDLLDSNDIDTNLQLAYRLIQTYYAINEKIVNSDRDECEQMFINLISKIRYLEVKRELCSKYGIHTDRINTQDNILVKDNYLIKGMGLFAAVKNRISFFNIFYFKSVDIVVEICGPNSYGCKRIKVENFKLAKAPKKFQSNRAKKTEIEKPNDTCNRDSLANKIPLKFLIKKQLIEISYLPIQAGMHKIEIVHQGKNILQSPYILKVDDCN